MANKPMVCLFDTDAWFVYSGDIDSPYRPTMKKVNPHNSPLFQQGKIKWDSFVAGYTGSYDFSMSVYAGQNQKVAFKCPVHGICHSDAKNLINGKTCVLCYRERLHGTPRMTLNKVLSRFAEVHKDTYDYSKVVYKKQSEPVNIICKTHGLFLQKPEFHWSGSGCPKCFSVKRGASQRLVADDIQQSLDDAYGTSVQVLPFAYENNKTVVTYYCPKHGTHVSTAVVNIRTGSLGCPDCAPKVSKEEAALAGYCSLFGQVIQSDRTTIKPKELDIYMPHHRLAIEYCGEYWHSDIWAKKDARTKHFAKHQACKELGIQLITIYRSEWLHHAPAIRRLIRNALGKSRGSIHARKCEVKLVPHSDAKVFYDKYHVQGGNGTGDHFGLYYKSKLVACMRFTFGINDRGTGAKNAVWTLSRYATRVNVVGGASRLFSAFIKEANPTQVKSFSDNRYFKGGMYAQLGFEMEAESAPDYQVWSPKLGLLPKSAYQRRSIPKRLVEHGIADSYDPDTDTRSEAEMTALMGAGRIYDCGKKKWVWTKPNAV